MSGNFFSEILNCHGALNKTAFPNPIYKRNIPGKGEPMKLYVSSGPKETKHICLMLDPERFPYIVT